MVSIVIFVALELSCNYFPWEMLMKVYDQVMQSLVTVVAGAEVVVVVVFGFVLCCVVFAVLVILILFYSCVSLWRLWLWTFLFFIAVFVMVWFDFYF